MGFVPSTLHFTTKLSATYTVDVLNINLLKVNIRSEVVGVSPVKLHLVHDDVQGPAVPEVHHQTPVKQGA